MREAFERWFYASKYAQVILPTEANKQIAWDGFQAAIAAIKDGGAVCKYLGDGAMVIEDGRFLTVNEPLYRIPEDV